MYGGACVCVCVCVLCVCCVRGCGHDTVSERLRRWTRNPLGSARRGSNPLGVVLVVLVCGGRFRSLRVVQMAPAAGRRVVQMTPAGLEPAIPGSVGRCLIHWATGPLMVSMWWVAFVVFWRYSGFDDLLRGLRWFGHNCVCFHSSVG